MKNFINILKVVLMLSFTYLIFQVSVSAQTIRVHYLTSEPDLDGSSADWGSVNHVSVPLTPCFPNAKSDVKSVDVKVAVYKNDVYLFAEWDDSSYNIIHKPFIWYEKESRYIMGVQREDRFSIQFAIAGNYTTDWFSGKEFKADMWHWKSSRTNPIGLAQDKQTIISSQQMKRSYKTQARNGKTIYLFRPSDAGDKLYYSKRYGIKEKDIMPKYFLYDNPKGSIADVKAKGIWKKGKWFLEMRRKLDTGHDDDVVFLKGKKVAAGIGIFNHSKTDDHNISKVLMIQF
jgi:hypothetical protein